MPGTMLDHASSVLALKQQPCEVSEYFHFTDEETDSEGKYLAQGHRAGNDGVRITIQYY